MQLATIPQAVQDSVDLANTDYDAFWLTMDETDRDLTETLTHSDSYDAVFLWDGIVYELSHNEITDRFDVAELGPDSDLTVYVNLELTGLSDEDELQEFADQLSERLPGFAVLRGQTSSGNSAAEWVRENHYVAEAWSKALECV